MKIGILGTGTVGRGLAGKLTQLGHDVVMGTRDVASTLAVSKPDLFGEPPFSDWHKKNQKIRLDTFVKAAAHGEMVINATRGTVSLDVLRIAGAENLNGKVILDVANELDFSKGMPPRSLAKDEESLGERIQKAFPETQVVKSLNTMRASVMVDPAAVANGDHTVFVSGNDAGAKRVVVELLQSFGWKDVIDLGDITSARGTEMLLPVWLRLWGTLGTPDFNFKIARNLKRLWDRTSQSRQIIK
ncbi:MAG TPA: NADP oxidoreductase [Bdellovibrionales bacterium]|nr:NADP oxidoreductase [Bdellovibrionales bacterium]